MFVTKHSRARLFFYKRELIACLMAFGSLFLLLALCSYNPQDNAWTFFRIHPVPITNWCGPLGAQSAAFLIYLFGSAAWIALMVFGAATYYVATQSSQQRGVSYAWEPMTACLLMTIAIPALCTLYGLTLYHTSAPGGGLIGYATFSLLYYYGGKAGAILCIYLMLYMSVVLFFQCSAIDLALRSVQYGMKGMMWVMNRPIVQSVGRGVKYALYSVTIYPVMKLGAQFKRSPSPLNLAKSDLNSLAHADHVLREMPGATAVVPENKPADQQLYGAYSTEHVDVASSPSAIPDEVVHHAEQSSTYDEQNASATPEPTQKKHYGLPNLNIFIGVEDKRNDHAYKHELEQRAQILQEKLERFGVFGSVTSIKSGPVVTLFEYQPHIDTKLSKILALEDDLALALQALSIRIIAPIPGRSVVGFEVSNKHRDDVLFAHVVQSREFCDFTGALPLVLGEDTIGNKVVVDLAKMPHLLVAGSTGSGKSVALNTMLVSLLCKHSPHDLKLILIDPKRLEFSSYADIAHLFFPIVTDPRRTAPVLRWAIKQMEMRYETMARYGVRNVFDYNAVAMQKGYEHFPYIVIVIDELSDLMLTIGREIEDLITRITQMARAAGIHMIVATQRPSVDVITGLIKVNFPSRISFRVTSKGDSRTILDCGGADKLLGRGDMLFLDSTASVLRRVHGAYVSEREIEQVVSHIRAQQAVMYLDLAQELSSDETMISQEDETLFKQVVAFIQEADEISISLIQRQFRIGYNRSARIIEMLEAQGLIMPADGGKMRRVIR